MHFERHLSLPLRRAAALGEPVLVQGPRGGGKTTLLRREFPGHRYVTLEDPADRLRARRDPAGFLARLRGPALIDDLHRAPELATHLAQPGFATAHPVVVASSRKLALAGIETFELHAPTYAERQRRAPVAIDMLGRFTPAAVESSLSPVWTRPVGPNEQDIRDLVSVRDLDSFLGFAAAARAGSGGILDQQALARECGVSHRTAVRWLAVLESCFLTVRLAALDVDFGRRLVRRDKLHFLDHPEAFESRVVSEIYRNARHAGLGAPLLKYWRDSNGLEIPLVIESDAGAPLMPVMIAATPTPVEETRLRRWMTLAGVDRGAIIASHSGSGAASSRRGVLRYALSRL